MLSNFFLLPTKRTGINSLIKYFGGIYCYSCYYIDTSITLISIIYYYNILLCVLSHRKLQIFFMVLMFTLEVVA